MKFRFLLIVACSLFFFGCDSKDGDKEYFTFKTNSQIVLTELGEDYFLANVDTGENLVFIYEFVKDDEPNIADDEYAERIIFEIDASVTSFSYTTENMSEIKMYFNQYCFCPSIESINVVNGTVEGERIDSSKWRISIDIQFELYENLQERIINGVFKLD